MKGRKIEEIGVSSRGMYMRNIADITPKWKDIRIADIIPNGSYLRSNTDIPKLSEIGLRGGLKILKIGEILDEYEKKLDYYSFGNNLRNSSCSFPTKTHPSH